ncbi:hypothetical protein [Hymenobacter sp. CRA2]|uniref:hypothetical protein n=1 Tax=Hymenobacter sp. CRA2 TaxID=1955620 RepID=UPI0009C5A0E8|nr:hypothetical protein [Hymenobacter sp. CRA2]OON70084.1 hypothetical protein B0919_04905 [Hymenobacter sp. CRA2]
MFYSGKTFVKQIILVLAIFLNASCEQVAETKTIRKADAAKAKDQANGAADVALKFINAYVNNCNKMKESVGVVEWVQSNNLATNRFKSEVKSIVDQAYKLDPEMGLDADPIFDAQDYPDQGFVLDSLDGKTNYVVVKGKDWPDFKLAIKVAPENNNWMVDGCGIINVPTDKRIAR